MGEREVGIEREGLLVERFGRPKIVQQIRRANFETPRTQIEDIGFGVVCRLGLDARFLRIESGVKGGSDFGGDFALQGERVIERAVVALRPDLVLGGRIDELHVDEDAVADSPDASHDHMRDPELLADLAQVPPCQLVMQHAGAADHF